MPDEPLREQRGRLVRDVWVEYARGQGDPKPSHLTGWDDLGPGDREADMRIGYAVATWERRRLAAHLRAVAEHDQRGGRWGDPSPLRRFMQRHGLFAGAGAGFVLLAAADEIAGLADDYEAD